MSPLAHGLLAYKAALATKLIVASTGGVALASDLDHVEVPLPTT